jgi:hypothetical protein
MADADGSLLAALLLLRTGSPAALEKNKMQKDIR